MSTEALYLRDASVRSFVATVVELVNAELIADRPTEVLDA